VPGMPQRGDSRVARSPPEARLRAPVTAERGSAARPGRFPGRRNS
jgi:hypothetical protein